MKKILKNRKRKNRKEIEKNRFQDKLSRKTKSSQAKWLCISTIKVWEFLIYTTRFINDCY